MKRLGILLSGRGSNFLAIADSIAAGRLAAEIAVVISNRPDAPGIAAARERGLNAVVLASKGYPDAVENGKIITGLADAAQVPDALVFHAGTRAHEGQVVSSGGRVLTVVGRGDTYEQAIAVAYRAAAAIHFDGVQFRKDIGRKALS